MARREQWGNLVPRSIKQKIIYLRCVLLSEGWSVNVSGGAHIDFKRLFEVFC